MLKFNKTYFLLTAFIALLLAGCTRHIALNKIFVTYPPPPDTARIQYLTSFSSSLDIEGKRSALQEIVLGDDEALSIGKPYGIATTRGKIFICDTSIGGIEILNLDKKTFTLFAPVGKGKLKQPINCFVDQAGSLYITDVGRKEVVVFDNNLNYVTAIGKLDTLDDFKPLDVTVSETKIWITNPKVNKIFVYQKDSFKLIDSFPDAVQGEDKFLANPINIFYRNNKVYVTDFGDFKVKVFTDDGKYLRSVGQYGKSLGHFVRPKGIAVDHNDNLFVVDAGFENIQMFNDKGKLLMFFGGPYKNHGDLWLPAKVLIDYENLQHFKKWVDPEYDLNYLIYVTNQYGPDKISVFGAIKPKIKSLKIGGTGSSRK